MRLFLIAWCFLAMPGCAFYENRKYEVTKTEFPDGRIVTETKKCNTSLTSSREVNAGDLTIGNGCTINGSADEMKSNDKAYEALNALIGKIP